MCLSAWSLTSTIGHRGNTDFNFYFYDLCRHRYFVWWVFLLSLFWRSESFLAFFLSPGIEFVKQQSTFEILLGKAWCWNGTTTMICWCCWRRSCRIRDCCCSCSTNTGKFFSNRCLNFFPEKQRHIGNKACKILTRFQSFTFTCARKTCYFVCSVQKFVLFVACRNLFRLQRAEVMLAVCIKFVLFAACRNYLFVVYRKFVLLAACRSYLCSRCAENLFCLQHAEKLFVCSL